jgi:hypothetical protein
MVNPTRALEELSREELIELIRSLMARVAALEAENERLRREGKRQAAPFSKGEEKRDPKPRDEGPARVLSATGCDLLQRRLLLRRFLCQYLAHAVRIVAARWRGRELISVGGPSFRRCPALR